MRNRNLPQDAHGALAPYAWPGGYTLVYILTTHPGFGRGAREEVLCASCATRARREGTLECWTHDEGEPVECERCGWSMMASYGIPSGWNDLPEEEARDLEVMALRGNLAILAWRMGQYGTMMPEARARKIRALATGILADIPRADREALVRRWTSARIPLG